MGTAERAPAGTDERDALAARYRCVRTESEQLCRPLVPEDYVIQTVTEASPAKWHLAHVSWFFETFLLLPFARNYRPFEPLFARLFNSYYDSVGAQWPRARRGQLSRPTVAEVYAYRAHIDEAMARLFAEAPAADWHEVAWRTRLGLNHEQQHQELLLTDLKQNLSLNPLLPAYRCDLPGPAGAAAPPLRWLDIPGGDVFIGDDGNSGFAFDNEGPRHRVWLADFRLASRTVTNAEFLAFIDAGGYREPTLWLSDGWATVQRERWSAPLHWQCHDGQWHEYTLAGLRPLDLEQPVTHVGLYEADAYARWAGRRLPTEAEWEHAAMVAAGEDEAANLRSTGRLQPTSATEGTGLRQMIGDVWEWTASPYVPYPGYRRGEGAFGEYNGKFTCNQWVVRGGSCVTPDDHIRVGYRNFFYPHDRWQFLGIRLAEDAQ